MPRQDPPKEHQFKPGQSGNPKGRPPKRPLTEIAEQFLDKNTLGGEAIPDGMTVAEAVVMGWFRKAIQGDPQARRDLLDRLEGAITPKGEPELEGDPGSAAVSNYVTNLRHAYGKQKPES